MAAPRFTDLVAAYAAGDETAIKIIDIAVDVVQTLNAVRNDTWDPDWDDEIRNDCDQAVDALTSAFTSAEAHGWVAAPDPGR